MKLDIFCSLNSHPLLIPSAHLDITSDDPNCTFTLSMEGEKILLKHGAKEIELKEKTLYNMMKYYWEENFVTLKCLP